MTTKQLLADLFVVIGLLLAVFGVIPFMRLLFRFVPMPPAGSPEEEVHSRRVSEYIGFFERLLIYMLVVSDNVSGIGFLIAAKSILRFSEIKNTDDRHRVESVLLGTLASFSAGLGVALVVRWAVRTWLS